MKEGGAMKRLGKTLKILFIIAFFSVLCGTGYFLYNQYSSRDAGEGRDLPQEAGRHGIGGLSQRQFRDEQEMLEILYAKRWISEEEPKWLMDFERQARSQLILLGPYPGGIEETSKFEVVGVNLEERSIIIHVTEVYHTRYPNGENGVDSEKVSFFERIILEDNRLIYEHKYESPEEKTISIWIAEN